MWSNEAARGCGRGGWEHMHYSPNAPQRLCDAAQRFARGRCSLAIPQSGTAFDVMKIIHLANHVLEIGNGIVNVMVDLACGQADAGHDVVVASSGGEYETL